MSRNLYNIFILYKYKNTFVFEIRMRLLPQLAQNLKLSKNIRNYSEVDCPNYTENSVHEKKSMLINNTSVCIFNGLYVPFTCLSYFSGEKPNISTIFRLNFWQNLLQNGKTTISVLTSIKIIGSQISQMSLLCN